MDELLPYYNRELAYIRKLGAEFAQRHPKIAGRLRLSKDMAEDPHVSRLVEAFAYLNARVRRKVDDEFPEITKALLETLYPHFLAPFPSCCIAQLVPDESLAMVADAPLVDRGTTVETEPIDGQPCRFRTCYPVSMWPIEVAEAGLYGVPLPAPATRFTRTAAAVVKITLQMVSSELQFDSLNLSQLRFYLHGQPVHVHDLYQRLFTNALGLAVTAPGDSESCVELDKSCIQPVGFQRDEGLVDYSPRSFLGYRLLTELFAFPEKFLFIDVGGLSQQVLQRAGKGNQLELYIFLDQPAPDLERHIERDTFALGCTPLVNLFEQRAEPIQLKREQYEYRIVPDARRHRAHEVHSITKVVATSLADEQVELLPLFSIRHGDRKHQGSGFWHATRQSSTSTGEDVEYGTEVFLSPIDLDGQPDDFDGWVADVSLTCLNRDLPGRLPFGGGQPKLQIAAGGALASISCLTPPTKTLRPPLDDALLWRLVSMQSLNHLSLVDGTDRGAALREVLMLYDTAASEQTRMMIEGLVSVESRRTVARAGGAAAGGFCRGLEVILELDEDRFTGGGLYLFASVLDRFLGLYTTINSFTQTSVTTRQREGILCQWPPRAAEQVLA